eukprot:324945-Chlamydomonas_euryale.AAC.1
MVSGRTVGIGAYLARLGRRCVQRSDQPIILTGFSALNKLLGRQVRGCSAVDGICGACLVERGGARRL